MSVLGPCIIPECVRPVTRRHIHGALSALRCALASIASEGLPEQLHYRLNLAAARAMRQTLKTPMLTLRTYPV
eukprot:5229959-Prymnesium_polylepis.2